MIRFQDFDGAGAQEIRATVEGIYQRAYVDTIAAGDPFAQPEAFMGRFDTYTGIDGFQLVVGFEDGGPAVGQSWGWPLSERAGAGWWRGLELDQGDLDEFTREDGTRTFALSEIMVDRMYTGRGIARALHDELIAVRKEERATLLVEPENDRAYRRYRAWGWSRVGVLTPSWPDAPTFDVLTRPLRAGGLA